MGWFQKITKTPTEVCQACKLRQVKVIDPVDNPDYPYLLCDPCHHQLVATALLPLQYFNLAALHGRTYLLHDDFYDDEGTAMTPEIEVEESVGQAFPRWDSLKGDLEQLINYAIVIWTLDQEILSAFSKFEKGAILNEFQLRTKANPGLAVKIYELTALTLGELAGVWIREEWKKYDGQQIEIFAEALAKCLPLQEGFQLYADALAQIDSISTVYLKMLGFIHFESRLTLQWITENIHKFVNISSAWGEIAAVSEFDWATAHTWIESGRPLSLVALDALVHCARIPYRSQGWRLPIEKLHQPDTVGNMDAVLKAYLLRDGVPRVKNAVAFVSDNWDVVLGTG
jgi:hypothetical protein